MDGKALLITGADMILETFFLLVFVQQLGTLFSLPDRNVSYMSYWNFSNCSYFSGLYIILNEHFHFGSCSDEWKPI
jgi:hypothetical protein